MENPDHFQTVLETESQRLNSLCIKWQEIFDASLNLTDELSGQILLAVGQTKLLIKEKFQQVRKLIEECKLGTGDKAITIEDLHGFWDLVCIQIEDVDRKFDYLETLSQCNPYTDDYSSESVQSQPSKILSELQENVDHGERLVVNKKLKKDNLKENTLPSLTADSKNECLKI